MNKQGLWINRNARDAIIYNRPHRLVSNGGHVEWLTDRAANLLEPLLDRPTMTGPQIADALVRTEREGGSVQLLREDGEWRSLTPELDAACAAAAWNGRPYHVVARVVEPPEPETERVPVDLNLIGRTLASGHEVSQFRAHRTAHLDPAAAPQGIYVEMFLDDTVWANPARDADGLVEVLKADPS